MMRSPSVRHADTLCADLSCPQCEYSLRGLEGAVVTCPECGFEVDVVQAVTSRWSKPWHRAPGLNRLLMPLVWLVCASMGVILLWAFEAQSWSRSPPWWTIAAATAVIALWALWLYRIRGALENGLAVPLSLLGHAIFAGYLLGIGMMISGLVQAYIALQFGLAAAAIPVLLTLIAAGLIVLGRHGEKFIASHCIRQHLIDRAKAATMES